MKSENNKLIFKRCKNCDAEYHKQDIWAHIKENDHVLNEWNQQGFCSLWCMIDKMIEDTIKLHDKNSPNSH